MIQPQSLEDQVAALQVQVAVLITRLDIMEKKRKGGRPKNPIQVKAEGVCGLDPTIDSSTCPAGSLYYRRQGCQGAACVRASSDYYKNRA